MSTTAKVDSVDVGSSPQELAKGLSSSSRRMRQVAAAAFAQLSRTEPDAALPFIDIIVESLKRPEARTRWESLDALVCLVPLDSKSCFGALEYAEEALFDESNGTVRLAAMRFLCKLGSVSKKYAAEVWPLIDEALRCYHGDPEYIDMLVAVNDFAAGNLPDDVREGLVVRMEFDANNPKSGLVHRSKSIIAAAKGEVVADA